MDEILTLKYNKSGKIRDQKIFYTTYTKGSSDMHGFL